MLLSFSPLQPLARMLLGACALSLTPALAQELATQGKCYAGTGSNAGKVAAFGEVRNNQAVPVRARGNIRIYDTAGKLMYERLGAISSIDLQPGETAPVYDVSTRGTYGTIGRCVLQFTYEPAAKFAFLDRGMVTGLKLVEGSGKLSLQGILNNPLGRAARYKLYITGYNAAGDVVMMAFQVSPGGQPVMAGGSLHFNVVTYDFIQKSVRLKALAVLQ